MASVWRVLVSFFGAAMALAPRTAWGAAPPVRLEVEGCPSLDARSVQRIFSADLGTTTTAEPGPDVTEVTITCEGDRVVVRVRDPLSRKTVKRSFDPKSFGTQAESRIVAIAASELVLASWAELAANPAPQVPPEGPPPSAAAVETVRSVVRARAGTEAPRPAPPPSVPPVAPPVAAAAAAPPAPPPSTGQKRRKSERKAPASLDTDRVTAIVSFRSFPAGNGTLWGGGARFGRERLGVVSWAVDTIIENGELEKHTVTSATAGGWVCFYVKAGPATFRGGGGLRAGVLSWYDGASAAVWGWPMAVLSQSIRLSSFVLELSGEGGFVNLLVPGKPEGVQGFWASGQVGVGIVP